MTHPHQAYAAVLAALFSLAAHAAPEPTRFDTIGEVVKHLAEPPPDARPLMRWWWFGPAVVKPELEREIAAMKAGGFGGFEIQPVYPMELDDPARGIRNTPYLSPDFLDALSFANRTGRAHGLRVDLTLASGWPYGGPHISAQQAASRLRQAIVEIPPQASSFALPAVMSGEKLVATFIGEGADAAQLAPLQGQATGNGRLAVAPSDKPRKAVVYIASRTGQQIKRAALGAEGFVLDHLSGSAVQHHLATVAEPLIKAFGDQPPYAVFSDSLEAYNTDWTDDFLAEFEQRRGYDLRPHIPAIFSGKGEQAGAIRRDWVLTQTELVNERYLTPIDQWAKRHGTQFRSQTYGEPAVSMSSNRLVALPEGEGPQFRAFSFTRLATSAGHIYQRPVISAETWTWLNSPAFSATPLDMKVEADRMFLQGVNQFVGHGWPYTPPGTPEPGYAFYAAGVFNDHNPWWNVMPEVNGYLSRVSYLLRQGESANDVAVYLPNDDVAAQIEPGKVSLSAEMHKYVTPELTEQILDAGFNLDYVDAEAVLATRLRHRVVVLPNVTRMAPEVLARLTAFARAGGKVIVVGSKPSLAPGFKDAELITGQVVSATGALFAAGARLVPDAAALGRALEAAGPDVRLSSAASDVGFIHRKLRDADIYFIANTSNHDVNTQARFRRPRAHAAWIDPASGRVTPAPAAPQLALAPYESRVLVFSDRPLAAGTPAPVRPSAVLADLGRDWAVRFPGSAQPLAMPALRSWTENESTRYLSGVAVYSKEVRVADAALTGQRILLDFGQGTPLATTPKVPAGMRAMLDSPVREAAQVIVNGQRAGAVWRPPYRVEIGHLLKPGANTIEVQVANLAVNTLAGRALPDYRLLSARYGQRFVPQDTELIYPRPAGLLGAVSLVAEPVK
ncbi:MAG: glycosyl hydrolase [Gammaproteobacteria bacterium]